MKLHKKLTDEKLEIAYLIISVFPIDQIKPILKSESIILDKGNLEWWQISQLLKVEMTLRGIVDNTEFQKKYIESKSK